MNHSPGRDPSPPIRSDVQRPWQDLYRRRTTPAARALDAVRRGNRVFIGSGCGEPQHLVQTLEELIPSLADVEILHILSMGKARFTAPGLFDKCRLKSFFVAAASRDAVAEGRADYTPINLVDIPGLFRSGAMPIDVALIQVSPPDEHGFCSYGIAVDIVKAAAESAKIVIAQVNPRMPRTLGDSFVHARNIDAFVEYEEPLLEIAPPLMNPIAEDIGRHVARLVEDGSTLRVGVGSLATAVLYALRDKKDLGVHADMLTDAYLHLVKTGVITNARKTLHCGKIVASFCLGSRELYEFVHNNPMVAMYPIEYTNDYLVISENGKMISINSGLEVDLTGQVCSDSLGYEIYSGVGGTIDFFRGAIHSEKGKAIVVIPSTTMDGKKSRIVPQLTEGAGVVTTRGGVHHVVTEYGAVNLHGKSIRERALALIGIAHPDFREELTAAARRLHYLREDLVPGIPRGAVYPSEWETSQRFEGGVEILFRPAKPTDERTLKEFFYSLPKDELYMRFLSRMKVFPCHDVQRMVNIDYRNEMSIVALAGEPGAERIIAFASYVPGRESGEAEVDFAVHPDLGRRGIATFLLRYLSGIAVKEGVKTFYAYTAIGNERALAVFTKLGYPMKTSQADGVHTVRVFFTDREGTGAAEGDHEASV